MYMIHTYMCIHTHVCIILELVKDRTFDESFGENQESVRKR